MYLNKAALGSQNIVFKFPAEKVFIFCYKRTDWIVCIWSDNSGVLKNGSFPNLRLKWCNLFLSGCLFTFTCGHYVMKQPRSFL